MRVLATLKANDADNRNKCIHLRDCFDYRGHICIVMDLLGQSVFDFLKGNSFVPFPNSQIQNFARQLFTSVACKSRWLLESHSLLTTSSSSRSQPHPYRSETGKYPALRISLPDLYIQQADTVLLYASQPSSWPKESSSRHRDPPHRLRLRHLPG